MILFGSPSQSAPLLCAVSRTHLMVISKYTVFGNFFQRETPYRQFLELKREVDIIHKSRPIFLKFQNYNLVRLVLVRETS